VAFLQGLRWIDQNRNPSEKPRRRAAIKAASGTSATLTIRESKNNNTNIKRKEAHNEPNLQTLKRMLQSGAHRNHQGLRQHNQPLRNSNEKSRGQDMELIDKALEWGDRHWKLIAIAGIIALLIIGPIN
jgi:hypothetical protein